MIILIKVCKNFRTHVYNSLVKSCIFNVKQLPNPSYTSFLIFFKKLEPKRAKNLTAIVTLVKLAERSIANFIIKVVGEVGCAHIAK